jgi:hypothetical protein
MAECCGEPGAGNGHLPRRHRCPVNGKEYGLVSYKTILHHLAKPWKKVLREQSYYFCSDSGCEVAYFGCDNTVIPKSELRTIPGVKENGPERTICYCFGVSYIAAKKDSSILKYVKEKTQQSLCSCETSNPSGRCCLNSFPKS